MHERAQVTACLHIHKHTRLSLPDDDVAGPNGLGPVEERDGYLAPVREANQAPPHRGPVPQDRTHGRHLLVPQPQPTWVDTLYLAVVIAAAAAAAAIESDHGGVLCEEVLEGGYLDAGKHGNRGKGREGRLGGGVVRHELEEELAGQAGPAARKKDVAAVDEAQGPQ